VHAGGGHVIYVQKFAAGCAAAPYHHFGVAALLGFVEAPDERRDHVAVFGVVVVAGAVEVGGHDAAVVAPVLPVKALAEFDARDLGDGIGLVGGL